MPVYGSQRTGNAGTSNEMQARKKRRQTALPGLAAMAASVLLCLCTEARAQDASQDGEAAPNTVRPRPGISVLRGTTAGTRPAQDPATQNAEDPFADGGIGAEDEDAPADGTTTPSRPARPARRLAEEDAQTTGRTRSEAPEDPVAGVVVNGQPDPRDSVAEDPVQTGSTRRPEVDPFLPVGFRAGSWNVFATLDQSVGYSNNTTRAPDGPAGTVSQTSVNVRAVSNWSRHEASIEANGALQRSLNGEQESIPSAGLAGNLRLDLIDGYSANLRTAYGYTTESTTSTSLGGSVSERPGVHSLGGSAELLRGGGKLLLSVRASADRTSYEDAALSGGGIQSQEDRNNTLYQLTGRAGYQLSPALTPFVQAGFGRRIHDLRTDRNGDQRDSTVADLRAGVTLDFGEKLRGEAAIGYLVEDFDGSSLSTLRSPSLNAGFVWSPERGTDISLNAATTFNGSTSAGDSGFVSNNFTLSAERRITDRLAANARLGAKIDSYEDGGQDLTTSVGAGLRYWVNRFLAITADVSHERLQAQDASRDFDASTVTLGVRLQR
jgi:hypothetical protein